MKNFRLLIALVTFMLSLTIISTSFATIGDLVDEFKDGYDTKYEKFVKKITFDGVGRDIALAKGNVLLALGARYMTPAPVHATKAENAYNFFIGTPLALIVGPSLGIIGGIKEVFNSHSESEDSDDEVGAPVTTKNSVSSNSRNSESNKDQPTVSTNSQATVSAI
ncbi:MAG: hypothetical protein HQK49_20535 [Oligoflexia bacterium]|nr:hypothetical protein [Oligoflexia bacterium]